MELVHFCSAPGDGRVEWDVVPGRPKAAASKCSSSRKDSLQFSSRRPAERKAYTARAKGLSTCYSSESDSGASSHRLRAVHSPQRTAFRERLPSPPLSRGRRPSSPRAVPPPVGGHTACRSCAASTHKSGANPAASSRHSRTATCRLASTLLPSSESPQRASTPCSHSAATAHRDASSGAAPSSARPRSPGSNMLQQPTSTAKSRPAHACKQNHPAHSMGKTEAHAPVGSSFAGRIDRRTDEDSFGCSVHMSNTREATLEARPQVVSPNALSKEEDCDSEGSDSSPVSIADGKKPAIPASRVFPANGFALDLSRLRLGRPAGDDDVLMEPSGSSPIGAIAGVPEKRAGGFQEPNAKEAHNLPDTLRASLKLNLSAISDSLSPAQRDRAVWEFDISEITLGHRIGAGAFGEVYEASWRRSRIAVKRLLCQRLTDSARSEFMHEMEIMSNLRHPHIVRFLGACVEPLQMSILFELCATSLFDVLHSRKQELTMDYTITIIRQVALGIFYLHQCKLPVLHLDLKSANVLLDEHGVAKVCDFGLSRIKKETAVITARMGSPQWTAPEILRGQPHDESADTYSYGILLYEIMAQQLPYHGVDTFQVVMGVITRMLPRPELSSDCAFPQQLQELMRSCWCEEQSSRPKFNQILDVADEALEQLALRPQLAGRPKGLGQVVVQAAIGRDVTRCKQADTVRSPASSQSEESPAGEQTPTSPFVRRVALALDDYVAQNMEELSFKRGDTIREVIPAGSATSLSGQHEDLWQGKIGGRVGLFRGSLVRFGQSPSPPSSLSLTAGTPTRTPVPVHAGAAAESPAEAPAEALAKALTEEPAEGLAPSLAHVLPTELRAFHLEVSLKEAYDLQGASLLSSGHGFETILAAPLDGGPMTTLTILRSGGSDWRARSELQLSLIEEVEAYCVGHVLPLLGVVRPPAQDCVAIAIAHPAGGDLYDRLERDGPMPELRAREITTQLLRALARVHDLNVVHGNLQPSALSFTSRDADNCEIRLGGLVSARKMIQAPDGTTVLLDGACGAPDYASPEVLSWMGSSVRRPYGTQADVWSAGVTLYVMLSGFLPFRGESPLDVLRAAAGERLEFPIFQEGISTAWAHVTPAAKEFVSRLLVVDPAKRMTVKEAMHHDWLQGGYENRVRTEVVRLRDRSREWTQLEAHSSPAAPKMNVPKSPPKSPAHSPAQQSLRHRSQAHEGQGALGNFSRWLAAQFQPRRRITVLILGLDNAGKTSLVHYLKYGEASMDSAPTIGHDLQCIVHAPVEMTLYDVGGQAQLRAQWGRYLKLAGPGFKTDEGIAGLIFVCDAANPERFPQAAAELRRLIDDQRLHETPFLVLANKMDHPAAKRIDEVGLALGIQTPQLCGGAREEQERCSLLGVSALCGDGLRATLDWILARA